MTSRERVLAALRVNTPERDAICLDTDGSLYYVHDS